MTHPASRSRLTTGASSLAGTPGRMIPPAVVTMPLTSTRSLTATRSPAPSGSEREMKAFNSTALILDGLKFASRRYPCPLMQAQTAGSIGANLSWSKVDVLTSFQRLTAEIQVRGGRLRRTINTPEPLFHLRNISAEPLVPGAVPLSGVPEGLFNKNYIGGIRTIEPEPAPPDVVAEMIRRYVMFQASGFMVTGAAVAIARGGCDSRDRSTAAPTSSSTAGSSASRLLWMQLAISLMSRRETSSMTPRPN